MPAPTSFVSAQLRRNQRCQQQNKNKNGLLYFEPRPLLQIHSKPRRSHFLWASRCCCQALHLRSHDLMLAYFFLVSVKRAAVIALDEAFKKSHPSPSVFPGLREPPVVQLNECDPFCNQNCYFQPPTSSACSNANANASASPMASTAPFSDRCR